MAVRISATRFRILFVAIISAYSSLIIIQHLIYTNSMNYGVRSIQKLTRNFLAYYKADSSSCKQNGSGLKGNLTFEIPKLPSSLTHSEQHGGQVKFGGSWSPKDCKPIRKVAILIPYRKRPQQLEVFLSHMHGVFQRQKLNYRVFVIEQAGNSRFNKGAIYNIGFNATLSYDDYECFIFHDIDLLSEHDHNFYDCPASPMHMSPAIDKFKYKLSYPTLIGGIQAITKEHYIKLNGYSNSFWGWGAEDDNLYTRIIAKGLKLKRPSMDIARYKMNQMHHFRSDGWSQANVALLTKRKPRQDIDGLNSFHKLNYTKIEHLEPLFTLISIDLIE